MKILQIHKNFSIKGGASKYFFELSKLLEKRGHQVAYFSMHDKKNTKTGWSKYFIKNISYEKVHLVGGITKFFHMLYSWEARRNIAKLLDEFKPDIVHIHSLYHHISPSIILELKKRNVPIVQTLHDYHLIAPSHTLFHDGKICEISKKNRYYKSILHKCVKNSYLASIAETIEQYVHHWMGIYENNVDIFIAPSQFLSDKIQEYGIARDKIQVLHNFFENKQRYIYKKGEYVLYFGRLSPEKGLEFLITAAAKLPAIPFKIVGDGPQKNELIDFIQKMNIKNVELIGYKGGTSLQKIILGCRFMVVPSRGYEIFPMSVLEAFSLGKPAVVSDIGGLPELVVDKGNGLLFKSDSLEDCIEKIDMLWNDLELAKSLGVYAKNYGTKYFGEKKHYEKIMEIYDRAINGKRLR